MSFPQQPDIRSPFASLEVPTYGVAYTSSDPIAYACDDKTGAWGYYASVGEASMYCMTSMQLDSQLVNN